MNPTGHLLLVAEKTPRGETIRQDCLDLGYTVEQLLPSGAAALQAAAERASAALVDLEPDGFETACRLQEERDIPVVLLTTSADPEILEQAQSCEMYSILVVPCSRAQLAATLEMAHARHSMARQASDLAVLVSEEKFRHVFEAANVGKSITTPGGEISVNQAFADMLGYTRDELAHTTWQRLTPPDEVGAIESLLAPLLRGEKDSARFTKRYIHKNGSHIWADVSVVLVRDSAGNPLHFITTVVDISDRVRVENALRLSEERFSKAFHASPTGLTITRITDGKIIDANQTFLKMFEYSRQEVIGSSPTALKILTPEQRAKLIERQIEVSGLQNTELQAQSRSGRTITILFSSKPIELEGEAHYLTTMIDISEQKQAQRELNASEARFRSYFESSMDALLLTSPDGSIQLANPAACRMLERTEEEIIQAGRADLVDVSDPRLAVLLAERAQTGKASGELTLFRRDGTPFPAEVSTVLFQDTEGETRTSMIIRDINERMQSEERLRESEARYRNLLEVSPVGIAVHSEGKIVFTNPAGARLMGADSPEQLTGRSIFDIIHPDGLKASQARIQRMLAGEPDLYPAEDVYLKLDGTPINVEVMATPLRYLGKPAVQVIVTDITERLRAREELRRRAEQLAALNATARRMMQALDVEDVARVVTSACVQNFGVRLAWLLRALPDGSMAHIGHYPPGADYPTRVAIRWDDSPLGQGPTGRAVRDQKPVVYTSLETAPDYIPWKNAAQKAGFATSAAFPLVSGHETVGCLNLYSDQLTFFSPQQVEFFETFTSQAAVTLANALLFAEVEQGRDQMRDMAVRIAEVEEAERKHIVRELHDRIGQSLAALNINLNIIQTDLPSNLKHIDARLQDSLHLLRETVVQTRSVIDELRPALLDDFGLVAALQDYGEQVSRRTGQQIDVTGEDISFPVDPIIETALFRIAQEAITNVIKHASASQVKVCVEAVESRLRLIVTDDGVGFDTAASARPDRPHSWGLITMRERIEALGGRFHIESHPGQGTRLAAESPPQQGAVHGGT